MIKEQGLYQKYFLNNVQLMQTIINLFAVTSFAVSASIVGSGYFIYHNRDSISRDFKEAVVEEVTRLLPEIIEGALGDFEMDTDLVPEVNTDTPALPF